MKTLALAATVALAFTSGIAQASSATNSLTVVVPRVDVAAPGQNQIDPNLIAWQTYDNFSGSSLDANLWEPASGNGALNIGAAGLTLTPTFLSIPGHNSEGPQATLPVNIGSYFAVRVPFLITSAVTGLSGNVNFNIDLCGVIQHQCNSLGWGFGKEFVPPGGDDPLSGTFFALGNDPFIFRATTVSRGQLAMIYSGGAITNFFDDGSGWQQIGASFSPPSDWTPSSVPLTLQLSADIHVVTSVPEPESYAMLLAGLGLLGFGARRRKQNAA